MKDAPDNEARAASAPPGHSAEEATRGAEGRRHVDTGRPAAGRGRAGSLCLAIVPASFGAFAAGVWVG